MGIFSAREIAAAKAYKYSGLDESIAIKLFYRRYWDYMIRFIPIWMAPNLITFIGFWFEIVSFALSLFYSEGLTKPIPRWVALVNGVFVFIYQTLDNLDGRQARRTQTSSALGQFFDHGCDAITGISELIKLCATFNLGASSRTFYLIYLIAVGFILTSWEEYVTKRFHLAAINAPDEGLGTMAVLYIIIAIYPDFAQIGQLSIWSIGYIILFALTIAHLAVYVCQTTASDWELQKKAIQSLIPGIVTVSLISLVVYVHKTLVEDTFFIMSAGYIMTYLSQLLIVARLTDQPVRKLYDWSLIFLWIILGTAVAQGVLANDRRFWKVVCAVIVSIMLVFDVRVVHGFATGLGIKVFKIPVIPVVELPVMKD
jgi:ethanolaminephosphotransferase